MLGVGPRRWKKQWLLSRYQFVTSQRYQVLELGCSKRVLWHTLSKKWIKQKKQTGWVFLISEEFIVRPERRYDCVLMLDHHEEVCFSVSRVDREDQEVVLGTLRRLDRWTGT